MVSQKESKFESFQKLKKNSVWTKSIFLQMLIEWYIESDEKINILMLRVLKWAWLKFLAILNESFFKSATVYFYRIIIVMVVHAVISIQFISIVYLTQIVTGVGKSKNNH